MGKEQTLTRWGILGAGRIAGIFASDLKHAQGAEALAVGSRSKEKAERFAAEFGLARSYGSYEELAADPDVQAVYVATPHPFHKENALTALRAGKAVLCEKPFTLNAGELQELAAYAQERRLFLMEAMWTRFLPAIRKVREWIREGRIGDVQLVKADFGFRGPDDPGKRLLNPELGGGSLLDAGVYPVSFAAMVFGTAPVNISSTVHIGETGVDERFSVLLEYEGGRTASLNGAIRLRLPNDASVVGTKGRIHLPATFLSARTAVLYVDGAEPETFEDDRICRGYAYEAEEAGRCLREGLTESPELPLSESLAVMATLDDIRRQWGLRYPQEA